MWQQSFTSPKSASSTAFIVTNCRRMIDRETTHLAFHLKEKQPRNFNAWLNWASKAQSRLISCKLLMWCFSFASLMLSKLSTRQCTLTNQILNSYHVSATALLAVAFLKCHNWHYLHKGKLENWYLKSSTDCILLQIDQTDVAILLLKMYVAKCS